MECTHNTHTHTHNLGYTELPLNRITSIMGELVSPLHHTPTHTHTHVHTLCTVCTFMYLSPFLSCHLFFSSSLWYITVSLASSTPAYVQLGLKGKAELFCLWYVPAGVLSEALPSDRSTQAARWFMVYQNSRVIIVFLCKGGKEPLEVSAIPTAQW